MSANLKDYLQDPFLHQLWTAVRRAGPIRSVSLDLTHICNLRCTGCYFFQEGMDTFFTPEAEKALDAWLDRETQRGTNFVTIVGGEPSLTLKRLKKVYDRFRVSVATNGLRRIPYEGFENLPIGISLWGNHSTDKRLRGSGKIEVFARALRNYKNDPRAFWYYTVAPGLAHEIEPVVEQCVANGNMVLFNYYSDLDEQGGYLDYRQGFERVRQAIEHIIERYPEHILTTRYLNTVVTTGRLFDQQWGYEVCTNVSTDYAPNQQRLRNGQPFNPHFRAYNADYTSTRRCCTGIHRDCDSCFDTWEHFSWIMIHLKKHLRSKLDFTRWLTTMYLFYFITRFIPFDEGRAMLPRIHAALRAPIPA